MSAPPLKTFGRTLQSGDPAPLDARRHRDMLVFLHPKKGSAAMASPVCSKCQQPSRRLEFVSNNAWVDYFRCETCGQVWACEYPDRAEAVSRPTLRVRPPSDRQTTESRSSVQFRDDVGDDHDGDDHDGANDLRSTQRVLIPSHRRLLPPMSRMGQTACHGLWSRVARNALPPFA